MNATKKRLIKLFAGTLIVGVVLHLMKFSDSLVGGAFAYGATLVVLPECLKSGELNNSEKTLYSFAICVVSIAAILLFDATEKYLSNIIVIIIVVICTCLFINSRKQKKSKEDNL